MSYSNVSYIKIAALPLGPFEEMSHCCGILSILLAK